MKFFSKFIIIFLVFAIIIVSGIIIYIKINTENIFFALYGNEEITIYEGDIYKEPGFIANDENGNSIKERVVIESNLNNQIVGNYTITYQIKTKLKTLTLKRIINVINDPLKNVNFTLNGSQIINLALNEEYIDPLYICIDQNTNRDLSDKVTIDNGLNNQIVGTYEVKYTLRIDGKEKILSRTVNVLEKKADFSLNTTTPTNQDITINFTSYIPNFAYLKDHMNNLIYTNTFNFTVNQNGIYKIIVYDNEENFEEYNIEVNNIDKEKPIITSCNGIINNNQTTFNITTNSQDILKYVINNQTFNQSPFTVNNKIENTTLTVYDKANNASSIICHSYYQEINPKGNENIIKNSNTGTLKIWIEKIDRSNNRTSYYTTHIWAINPYNQFKMQVPDNFGAELLYAQDLLNNAISQNNWQTKLMVGVNASGFIKNGTYAQKFYNANKGWNLTGGSPLVIVNGKILRDFATSKIPNGPYTTYGLKSDGYLSYYNYTGGTSLQSNINVSNQIINDGVLSTFAFSPVLVANGKKADTSTSKNIRQGFCQIDKNNFVFITDIYTSARNGFNFSELADYMISLGCQTGFNLDGGGSTSLIFKDKNQSSEVITGNTRKLADVIYFHE